MSDQLQTELDMLRAIADAAGELPAECGACAAKPGAPTLCAMCLAVRRVRALVVDYVRSARPALRWVAR